MLSRLLISLCLFIAISGIMAQEAPTLSPLATNYNAHASSLFQLPIVATDPDGNALSYSFTGLPAWLTFQTTTNSLVGTPPAGFSGVVGPIVASVTDNINYHDGDDLVLVSDNKTNGSTVFVNEVSNTTATKLSSPTHRTSQFKFRTSSIEFNGTVNNDDRIRFGNNAAWSIGTSDFYLECWVRPTAQNTDGSIIASRNYDAGSASGIGFNFSFSSSTANPKLRIAAGSGAGLTDVTFNTQLPINTWYFIRLNRVSGVVTVYINGVAEATKPTIPNINMGTTGVVFGGLKGNEGWDAYGGHLEAFLDDFVLHVGNAHATPTVVPTTKYGTVPVNSSPFTITVLPPKIRPVINWTTPTPISYDDPLTTTQLNAKAVVPVSSTNLLSNGTFDASTAGWTAGELTIPPTANALLSIESQKLRITSVGATKGSAYQRVLVTPHTDYRLTFDTGTATDSIGVKVNSANDTESTLPGLDLLFPASTMDNVFQFNSQEYSALYIILYSNTVSGSVSFDNVVLTSITGSQEISGTFTYDPPLGSFLSRGSLATGAHQLSVTFVPDDTQNYEANDIHGSVTITAVTRNHQPSMVPGPDLNIRTVQRDHTITAWVQSVTLGPARESSQSVKEYRVTVASQFQALFSSLPAIDTNGTLRFTLSSSARETINVPLSIRVQDDGGTDNDGIDLSDTVTAVIHISAEKNKLVVTSRSDSGPDTLRECMLNARPGDTITFDTASFSTSFSTTETTIDLLSALPELDDGNITIDATNTRVTLNGSGAGSADGFTISSNNNRILGLSIISFTGSGIVLRGTAQKNQLGGSRALGPGPNGQGLRIAGNGSRGIILSGTNVQKNAIVGCWIGVNANGTSAEPNLSGIVISDGATDNIIGSTNAGWANIISGNRQEGITITGLSSGITSGTIIIGNIIGAGNASTRSSATLGNGGSGIYIGTYSQNTRIGSSGNGTDDKTAANTIVDNDGYGIEVHSSDAQRHSFRSNRIYNNALGGIALLDGANGNVTPPTATAVANGDVSGTASADGTIEFYNDAADQGAEFIGRATVTNGTWSASLSRKTTMALTATFTDSNGNSSSFVTLDEAHSAPADESNESGGACGLGSGVTLIGLLSLMAFLQMRFSAVRRTSYSPIS